MKRLLLIWLAAFAVLFGVPLAFTDSVTPPAPREWTPADGTMIGEGDNAHCNLINTGHEAPGMVWDTCLGQEVPAP